MKIRVKVKDVEVTVEGVEPTMARTRRLMKDAAAIAEGVTPSPPESAPVGFTADIERAAPVEPDTYYEDEDVKRPKRRKGSRA